MASLNGHGDISTEEGIETLAWAALMAREELYWVSQLSGDLLELPSPGDDDLPDGVDDDVARQHLVTHRVQSGSTITR